MGNSGSLYRLLRGGGWNNTRLVAPPGRQEEHTERTGGNSRVLHATGKWGKMCCDSRTDILQTAFSGWSFTTYTLHALYAHARVKLRGARPCSVCRTVFRCGHEVWDGRIHFYRTKALESCRLSTYPFTHSPVSGNRPNSHSVTFLTCYCTFWKMSGAADRDVCVHGPLSGKCQCMSEKQLMINTPVSTIALMCLLLTSRWTGFL